MPKSSKKRAAPEPEEAPVFPEEQYHVSDGLKACPDRAAVATLTHGNRPVAIVWSKERQPATAPPTHVEELRPDSINVMTRMRSLLGLAVGGAFRIFRTTLDGMTQAMQPWRKNKKDKRKSRYLDWSKGINQAVEKCYDMTGQEFVVYEADPEHGPGTTAMLGTKARVLLAVGQVEDEADITAIQDHYNMCKHLFSAKTSRMGNDHQTEMVGKSVIHTNPAAVSPGYGTQLHEKTAPSICDKHDPNEREVKALAETVWTAIAKKFPFIEEYRSKVLTELTKEFAVLGATATNIIAKSTNTTIKLHMDTKDGPLSIILWMYGGSKGKAGGIKGGHFCILDLGVKFIPLRCTVVVMRTNMLTHGTLELSTWGGAFRVGSSHFLRMPDAAHVSALSRGVQRLTRAAVHCGLDLVIKGSDPAAAVKQVQFLPAGGSGDLGCYELQVLRDVAVRDHPAVAEAVITYFKKLRSLAIKTAGKSKVTVGGVAENAVFWKVYEREPERGRGRK